MAIEPCLPDWRLDLVDQQYICRIDISRCRKKEDPLAALRSRLAGYTQGDTDLAWSRITYWRALLASTPHEQGVPAAPGQAAPPASAEASK